MSASNNSKPHTIRIVHKGLETTLDVQHDEFLIGSDESAHIRIADSAISRKHAIINISYGKVFVRDLGSTNGTFINDVKIPPNEDIALNTPNEMFSLSKIVWVSIITEASESPPAFRFDPPPEPPQRVELPPESPFGRDRPDPSTVGTGSGLGLELLKQPARTEPVEAALVAEAPFKSPSPPDFRKPSISAATNDALELLERQIADLNSRHASLEADFRVRKLSLDSTIGEMELRQAKGLTDLENLLAQQKIIASDSAKMKLDTDQQVAALMQQMQTLELDKRALQEKFEQDQIQAEQLRTEMKERESTLATLRKDGADARIQTLFTQDEQKKAEVLWKETREQIEHDLLVRREASEREITETNERISQLKADATRLDELIKNENETYQKILQTNHRETETLDYELSKRRAASEVEIAEARIKKLGMDASVGDAEAKLTDLKRQFNDVMIQKIDVENESKRLRTEAQTQHQEISNQVQTLKAEAKQIEDRIQTLKNQTSEQETGFARAKEEYDLMKSKANSAKTELAREESILMVFLERSKSERKKIEDETRDAQKRVDQEVEILRKEAEKKLYTDTVGQRAELEKLQAEVLEVLQQKEKLILQMRNEATSQLQAEIDRQRAEVKVEIEAQRAGFKAEIAGQNVGLKIENDARRAQLESELSKRKKDLETELANTRLQEMNKIDRLREEAEAADRTKRYYVADDIVNTVMDYSHRGSLEGRQAELKKVMVSILNGESRSSVTAQAAERTRHFWKKIAVFISGPLSVIVFFAIFPGTFGMIKNQFNRTVASEQKDSGIFLNEIQQKGTKYQPEMDGNYRATYSDNILYLRGYVEMKLDQEYEKKWTLLLNEFIVGRLSLSDRIIPNFIADEAVMIKELMTIRGGILPQFKEQGLSRMNTTEQQQITKILDLLQSPENYQKFRTLERDFYAQYIKEKGTPASPPVSASH